MEREQSFLTFVIMVCLNEREMWLNTHLNWHFLFVCFWHFVSSKTGFLCLSWSSLCRWGWPRNHRDLPVSASSVWDQRRAPPQPALFVVLKTGSCVAQSGFKCGMYLRMNLNFWSSCLYFSCTGITGMCAMPDFIQRWKLNPGLYACYVEVYQLSHISSLCWHFLDIIQSKHERASYLSKDLISLETFILRLGK